MKINHCIFRLLPIATLLAMTLSACKKETTTCCQATVPDYVWELKFVTVEQFYGAGVRNISRHEFTYNEYGKIRYYEIRTDYINPAAPVSRSDTFYYDAQQRVSYIIGNESEPYKKVFSYDGSGRKSGSKKYFLNSAHQYYLVDSTVYQYQDTVISKIAHYVNKAPDTAVFVYNSQQNLVSFRMTGLQSTYQEFDNYDDRPNGLRQTHMESIEADPSYTWVEDFGIMMMAPVLPRNNFQTRRIPAQNVTYDYSNNYGDLYNLLSSTYTLLPGFTDFTQSYSYLVRK